MSMLEDYSAFASAAARFHLLNPDLAPDAGRKLLEVIAAGFAHTVDGRQFCTLCQCEIQGAQGHTVSCPTMLARRIRANEAVQPTWAVPPRPVLPPKIQVVATPVLRSRRTAPLETDGDPTPAPHRQEGSGQRTGTGG